MITLLSIILALSAALLLVVMIKDGTQRRPDLLSMRNIFLLAPLCRHLEARTTARLSIE